MASPNIQFDVIPVNIRKPGKYFEFIIHDWLYGPFQVILSLYLSLHSKPEQSHASRDGFLMQILQGYYLVLVHKSIQWFWLPCMQIYILILPCCH